MAVVSVRISKVWDCRGCQGTYYRERPLDAPTHANLCAKWLQVTGHWTFYAGEGGILWHPDENPTGRGWRNNKHELMHWKVEDPVPSPRPSRRLFPWLRSR